MELTHCCGKETFVTSGKREGFSMYIKHFSENKILLHHSKTEYSHMEDSYETVLYKASHRSAVKMIYYRQNDFKNYIS